MKRTLIPVITLIVIFFAACNNSGKKSETTADSSLEKPKTIADTLLSQVMEGHDESMSKMGRLEGMQKQVQGVLDSIGKLPAKTKKILAPYQAKMEGVLQDLKSAKSRMDIWMDEFNYDSAVNDMEKRLKYLRDEKFKISTIKEDILHSLQRADSIIKAKL